MLDSVMEYITQAASSYAFIFCFCNLIIVFILVDLKPKLSFDQEGEEIPLSVPTNRAREVAHAKEEVAVDNIENEGNGIYNSEEDDELKRRVEEFIERVNEGWKSEYLSTSSFLWGENNKELLE
ncbi:hypothetical protein E2542_SST23481 [Spatholobus suberectus]|nr:hypothetical protein E2542_SST23481 [Spatholobus suberectus]